MARLKLLIFALPALALWLVSLGMGTEAVATRAAHAAADSAERAADALTTRLDARRIEVETTLLKLHGTPSFWLAVNTGKLKNETPSSERFAEIRDAVLNAFPSDEQSNLVVGVNSTAGGLFSKGKGEGVTALPGLDSDALAQAGTDGLVKTTFGEPYVFYAVPLNLSDTKLAPLLIVGAPLVRKTAVAETAKDLGLVALATVSGKKILASAGTDAPRSKEALDKIPAGGSGVLTRVGGSFGPFKTPMGLKDGAPGLVAVRRSLAAAPIEIVAVADAEPTMKPLADAHRTALTFWLVSLVLGVISLVWVGTPSKTLRRSDEAETEAEEDVTSPGVAGSPPPPPADSIFANGPAVDEQEEGTVANANAPFDFPPPPPVSAPPVAGNGASGFDFGGTFGSVPPPPVASTHSEASKFPFDFESKPTAAYPNPPPPDAFAQSQNDSQPYESPGEFNPDATRVAMVPSELIAATQRNASDSGAIALPAPRAPLAGPAPIASVPFTADEQHFQDVYRDFMATRDRCGEPADGLTYEKFAVKLKKNRDQLMQKLACRTVRFQVYVKEGKAALRATPIKD